MNFVSRENVCSSREKLRFEGNRIHYSPRDKSLSDLLFNFAKRAEIPATTSGYL